MKIAILGTRGIPANYGGFETFAEECGARLAARGHAVTVYCRSHHVERGLTSYRNVRLIVLPTLRWKYTDTLVHGLFSTIHALQEGFDVILICNAANSIYSWLPRIMGIPVVVNVDGIERLRRKWNWAGKKYYRLCERLSTWFPNAIVTDARVIERYYQEEYGAGSVFIPYGSITEKTPKKDALERLGLRPGEFFLYVSRLEPENNALLVVRAFEKVRTGKRLIVVGDAPYAGDYIRKVKATPDERVIFPGAIYGAGYRQLLANALCYIHATEVGGTHPALLEAMGQGNIIIANETPENREVLAEAGLYYRKNDAGDLTACMQKVEDRPGDFKDLRQASLHRARTLYSWDEVVSRYEILFEQLVGSGDRSLRSIDKSDNQ